VRKILSLMVVVVATFSIAGLAMAAPPDSTTRSGGLHFVAGPDATITGTGALNITGEVAGAGQTATGTLSYDLTVTTGCINPGSKDQEPSGLQSTTTSVDESFDLRPTRQGRATINETTNDPTTSGRECPRPMRATIVDVTYTNVVLTISSTSGTVTASWAEISN